SNDNTISIIEEKFQNVRLIKLSNNLGFGKANNIGISEALAINADYIFLLNQDAYVEKDTIHHLVNAAELNKEFGVLSGIHFSKNKISLDYNFSIQIGATKCPNLIS